MLSDRSTHGAWPPSSAPHDGPLTLTQHGDEPPFSTKEGEDTRALQDYVRRNTPS